MSVATEGAAAVTRSRRPHRLINGQNLPHPGMRLVKGVALFICCALVILPFVGIVSTSLAPASQLQRSGGFVLWPESVNLDAFASVFAGGIVTRGLMVSIVVTTAGTFLALLVSSMFAYALSRPAMTGRTWMLMLLLVSLLFSPGIIPVYLVVKELGLINSLWAVILPGVINAFNVIVLRAFFMGLPSELLEAAKLDGASEWQTFTRVVLPLSKAVLAVVGLFYAVGYWNSFFNALLYLNDSALWPLPLIIRTYVINNASMSTADIGLESAPAQPALQMALLLVSIAPILLVYPFLQRHFSSGVLTGAVKG